MKILYYNLQLGTFDGGNAHALGMLIALKKIYGDENVQVAIKSKKKKYNHTFNVVLLKISKITKQIRQLRRKSLARKQAKSIMENLEKLGFVPDVIFARSVLYDITPILLSKLLECKLVIEHNTPLVYERCYIKKIDNRNSVEKYERLILKSADGIYVVSDVLKNMMLNSYDFLNEKDIVVVPNGYMYELYNNGIQSDIRENTRNELSVNKKWVIIFIGSLQIWHGINILLDTAKQLDIFKDIEFWILGDGEEREKLKRYIGNFSNLKWFGNVKFDRMRDLLLAADLGIMPYDSIQNFYFSPLKMFDMIGAGLPFIGLEIGQIGDFCNNYLSDKFLFNKSRSDLIASQILKIKSDNNLYTKMKEEINNIREDNSWNNRASVINEWMKNI